MPEPVAAPAAASVPIVTPPADQPPAAEKPKSFEDRWKAKEAELGTTEENAEEAAAADPSKPAEPDKPKAEVAKPKSGEPTAGDRGMFEALAKKLGYSLDDKKVLPSDRIAWEASKKRQEEGLAKREAEANRLIEEAKNAPAVKQSNALVKAVLDADPTAIAKAMAVINPDIGDDWDKVQERMIKRLADPNHAELQELKKWREQEEQAKVERKKAEEEQQKQQHRQVQLKAYLDDLSEKGKTSTDTAVSALSDDPLFLDMIYRIQQQEYKPSGERILPPEEALDKRIGGAKMTAREELKSLAQRLLKAFPDLASPAAAPDPAKPNGKRPAPRTAVTPPNTVDTGGAPKRIGEMTDAEWREYKQRRYAEADKAG